MRAVLINHCHPDTPHICGVRLREFGLSLAKRGHQVVLLTAPLDGETDVPSPDVAAASLGRHDFSAPFRLPVPPSSPGMLALLRNSRAPRPIRQGIVLWHYLNHGGVFTDWRRGAARHIPMLAGTFDPDIVWSSFGNTDCWNIAQMLSSGAGCRWVADIKDFWSAFIAPSLRKNLARRYSDAAAFTALSNSHAEDAAPWFGGDIHTVYSGVDGEALATAASAEGRSFSLTGAISSRGRLIEIKSAIKRWLESLPAPAARDLEFIYCGNDAGLVGEVFDDLHDICRVTVNGYVPINKLRNIHSRAFANLYIKSERTFHHKVVELFAAGRPVICYPEEGAEAKSLAGEFCAVLHSAGNADEIVAALGRSFERYPETSLNRERAAAFTWDAQAEKLEAVLLGAIKGRPNG